MDRLHSMRVFSRVIDEGTFAGAQVRPPPTLRDNTVLEQTDELSVIHGRRRSSLEPWARHPPRTAAAGLRR